MAHGRVSIPCANSIGSFALRSMQFEQIVRRTALSGFLPALPAGLHTVAQDQIDLLKIFSEGIGFPCMDVCGRSSCMNGGSTQRLVRNVLPASWGRISVQ